MFIIQACRCIIRVCHEKTILCISTSDWYKILDNSHFLNWQEIMSLFYTKFYPLHEIHRDMNYIYNFWSRDGESIAQAWGRLKSLMLKCPIHELTKDMILTYFYARLSRQDKEMLD